MTDALLKYKSPEEREYERYLGEIDIRKQRIAVVRTDLETLESDLGRFEAEYHTRVGRLLVELDKVKLAIEEYERRIWWLETQGDDTTAEEIEEDVEQTFESRREEVRDEDETTRDYEERFEEQRRIPKLEADDLAELQRLHRELARRFHPDLARTDEERARRTPIMQQINGALAASDLAAMRELARASDYEDPRFEEQSIGEKLVWAIREIARLDDVLASLDHRMTELWSSSIYALWQQFQTEPELFTRLTGEIEQEIELANSRLSTLIGVYRELLSRQDVL